MSLHLKNLNMKIATLVFIKQNCNFGFYKTIIKLIYVSAFEKLNMKIAVSKTSIYKTSIFNLINQKDQKSLCHSQI